MCGKGIQDKTTGAEAQRDKQVFWDGSLSHNILSMVVSLFSPERILKLIQGARWKQMQQMGMLQVKLHAVNREYKKYASL